MRSAFPHEKETVELVAAQARPTAQLWPLLRELGFSLEGGAWALRREGEVPNAQHEDFASLDIYHAEQELDLYFEETFESEDSVALELDGVTVWLDEEEAEEIAYWDRITLDYWLAYLPEECIESFLQVAEALAKRLGLSLRYDGQEIAPEELGKTFRGYCTYLETEYGGAGSMTIRHFIDLHYDG